MKHWFVFCPQELLLEQQADGSYSVPFSDTPPTAVKPWTTIHNLPPMSDGIPVCTYRIEPSDDLLKTDVGAPLRLLSPLRASYYKLPHPLYLMAGKCQEILYWDCNTRFCGVCGAPMQLHTAISKRCTQCGKEVWPQLATAVIVLIHRGDEILMVRARNFRGDFYGLVAGFVETGETLEEAVQREVMEETGITITNIRYFASQPWPYPCGLMVGFNADYVSGTIKIQQEELSNAGWFRRDNLPHLPEKLSIARKLVDNWLEEQ